MLVLMVTAMAYNAFGASDAVTNTHSKAALGLGAAAVLALQALRVRSSQARAANPAAPTARPGFFGLTANLQLQILLLWFVTFAAGLTAAMIRTPT